MRIRIRGRPARPQEVADRQAFCLAIDLRVDLIARIELVLPRQFFTDRDRARAAQPLLQVELSGLKICQIKIG